ncbi:MAG TPA: hypothetical protein VNQ79_13230, partial [Blastocatellia bacterium]|nr:hypothetical protein [Blastocatellia bacterium]
QVAFAQASECRPSCDLLSVLVNRKSDRMMALSALTTIRHHFLSCRESIGYGGISVTHDGSPEALVAHGFVVNKEKGFASNLYFVDPAGQKSQVLDGTGLLLARPALASALTNDSFFEPFLTLRNTSASPQAATVTVQYTVGGKFQTRTLPVVSLKAYEVRPVDFSGLLASLNSQLVDDAGIRIETSGAPGTIIGQLASVSNFGVCVDVPLLSVRPNAARSGAHPFNLNDDSQAVLHLKNIGTKPTRSIVHVLHETGDYALDLVKIQPGESVAIDIRKLAASEKQDIHGNILPASVARGQVTWVQHGGQTLIGRLIQFSPSRKSAANFSCGGLCNCEPEFDYAVFSPSDYNGSPNDEGDGTGQTGPLTVYEWDHYLGDCSTLPLEGPFTADATFESLNSSVANVDAFGSQLTLVGPGDTNIRARWYPVVDHQCSKEEGGGCNTCTPVTGEVGLLMPVKSTRVRIENDAGTNLAGTTQNVIVGQHIRLFLHTIPARSYSNLNWTITGQYLNDWVITYSGSTSFNSTASLVSPDLHNTPVNFFWHDGNFNGKSETVTMALAVLGKQFQRSVNYKVFRPLVSVSTQKGAIAVDNNVFASGWWLHYGRPIASPGMQMNYSDVTIPLNMTGQWQWVQTSSINRTIVDSVSHTWVDYGLDGLYPYSTSTVFEDSSGQQLLSGLASVTCSDSFEVFLMFKPDSQNAHWVPMKKGSWSWYGQATYSMFSGWSLASSSNPNPTVIEQVHFPTWNKNNLPNFQP